MPKNGKSEAKNARAICSLHLIDEFCPKPAFITAEPSPQHNIKNGENKEEG
jgi:hypothetical protein